MSKKMLLVALAIVSAALLALPAVAAAQSWHLDSTPNFGVTGSGGELTSSLSVGCTTTQGAGVFNTTTEGTVTLAFTGCKETVFGQPCTTPGSPSGTIAAATKFDGIMVNSAGSTKDPGVLLTPDTSVTPTESSTSSELKSMRLFTEFSCFGVSVKVFGKGVIGTLSPSVCSEPFTTATLTFASTATGVQADQLWTGGSYDLRTNLSANHPTASLDGAAILHFQAARNLICT